jgi:hypothetical protein
VTRSNGMSNALASIRVANAPLPAVYENAKTALADCARIDECQKWANKAEALASYARQADDDTLRKLADRIQARAVRRAGQLLKTFQTGPKGGRPSGNGNGTVGVSPRSQKQAAEDAGMSQRQRETAVRVANVPDDIFEVAVESDAPPTVTQLAEIGKKSWEVPQGFQQATRLLGAVRRFAKFCSEHEPDLVANGVLDTEVAEVRQLVATIDAWLDRFVVNLKD